MIEKLIENVAGVQSRIADAAARSGRTASEVTLIGVTKYVDAETTKALFEAGCGNLGENRPQVVWEKSQALADSGICWHMIGHLQRNKVKRTVECCELIHSVDSERLLIAINDAGKQHNKIVRVLLEVNVSGDESKHGFVEADISTQIEAVSKLPNVKVEGLMCMAGLTASEVQTQNQFANLKKIQVAHRDNAPDNVNLNELSMGMSGDFEAAIEEGATMVRVGSLLFKGV